jgi:beta-N-acetylhexosaminidase
MTPLPGRFKRSAPDVDGTPQGVNNELIGNRVFGGTPQIVYAAASHYLFGIKETGTLPFIKHYPGYGFVKGCAHGKNTPPSFTGGPENLKINLDPFRNLAPHAAGIVSAHIHMAHFEPERISSLSEKMMKELLRRDDEITIDGHRIRGIGASQAVLVADDLSDMGVILKYMEERHLSYADIANLAIDAGHDLLLFSHLETERQQRGKYGNFALKDLRAILDSLCKRAKTNLSFEKRIRESLFRILRLKAQLLKIWHPGHDIDVSAWKLPRRIEGPIESPSFLSDEGFTSGRDLIWVQIF